MTNEAKARELAGFKEGANPIPTQRFVFDKCIEMAEWKDKQMMARAREFIKEIARVCDITDENGYRIDERYLLAEFEKSIKGE